MENKKVLLGMSGGVDSSVSALLLKQQGYEVIGATMELFAGSSCCNINTYIDAKNVCFQIGIPHFTYDYKEQFKKHVIDDFISCYANCKTPNPCIECNKYLKFGFMYEKAKELLKSATDAIKHNMDKSCHNCKHFTSNKDCEIGKYLYGTGEKECEWEWKHMGEIVKFLHD